MLHRDWLLGKRSWLATALRRMYRPSGSRSVTSVWNMSVAPTLMGEVESAWTRGEPHRRKGHENKGNGMHGSTRHTIAAAPYNNICRACV